jgi:hypothetical protein
VGTALKEVTWYLERAGRNSLGEKPGSKMSEPPLRTKKTKKQKKKKKKKRKGKIVLNLTKF